MTREEAEALLGQPAAPAAPATYSRADAEKFLGGAGQPLEPVDDLGRSMPGSSPEQDQYISQSGIGHVLHAFGQGVSNGWGAGDLGIEAPMDAGLRRAGLFNENDANDAQKSIVKTFNEVMIRPAAAALDGLMRVGSAGIAGLQSAIAETGTQIGMPQLGRDVAAGFEAFPAADPIHAIGELSSAARYAAHPVAQLLDKAVQERIIGPREPVVAEPPAPPSVAAEAAPATLAAPEPAAASIPSVNDNVAGAGQPAEPVTAAAPDATTATPEPTPDAPPAPTDAYSAARQIAPETFQEFDVLQEHKDNLRRQIDTEQKSLVDQARMQAPGGAEIQRLQERMQDTTPRLAKKYQARIDELMPAYQAYMDDFSLTPRIRSFGEMAEPEAMQNSRKLVGDLRQQLAETDYRMRDLSPAVSDATRRAAEQFPTPEPEAAAVPDRVQPAEPAPQPTPEPVAPEQAAAPAAAEPASPAIAPEPAAVPRETVSSISDTVAADLQKAGRPAEEAQAAGQVTEALWKTRADAFDGAKGSAEEMYAREAPSIRAGRERVREPEMAQGLQGKIKLATDGRSVITLMKSANASTYIHEMGHDWLERMMGDARDTAAPDRMRQDAAIVRSYLGVGDGEAIPTKAHEKFARSFERYFMEGRAPSQALAGVFRQFKDWLTNIYQTVAKLRAPITADIRDVFDRMLASDPERHVSIVGESLRDDPPPAPAPVDMPLMARTIKEPERLANYVRRMGGLTDEGGDVRSMLGGARFRPGLISKSGMSLDEAALRAHEAGYFPDHGAQRPSANDLLDALSEDVKENNPRYSAQDAAKVEDYQNAANHNSEIDRLAEQYGIDHRGMTRSQFFSELSERTSQEQWDTEMRSLEESHEADFGEFAAEARDWMDAHNEAGWDSDKFYGIEDGPRPIAELEDAYSRSLPDAGPMGQGEAGAAQPGAAPGFAEPGEGGGGQSRNGAGDAGRPAGNVKRGSDIQSSDTELGRPDDGLIDKAGNIRLDNLRTPEDVSQVIRDTAAQNGDFQDARRGVISDNEVIQLADDLGMTPGALDKRKLGEAFNAEQVMAARKLLKESAFKLRDAMAKAAGGTDADVLAYAEARAQHRMIQEQVSGITAEAGRALRAFRDMGDGGLVKDLDGFLRENTGRTLNQLRREAKLGAKLDTSGKVSKFINDAAKPTWDDKIFEFYVNNLISGPVTHMTYAAANQMLLMYRAGIEAPVAAGVGRVAQALGGERGVYGKEVVPGMYALIKGQRDGVRAAWDSAKSGSTTLLPGERPAELPGLPGAVAQGAIGGTLGTIIRIPSRGVGVIHSYFRTIGYESNLAQLVVRQAMDEGLSGPALHARIASLTADPEPAMMEAARHEATQGTLMGQGGDFTRKFKAFVNAPVIGNAKLLRYIDPFVNISANIMVQSLLERSPVGLLSQNIRDNIMGRNGAAARDTQISRLLVGSTLMTVAGGLAAEGLITGSSPHDAHEREIDRQLGIQPYSVKIGGSYYSTHRLGPLGMMLGIAADMHSVAGDMAEGEFAKAAGHMVASVGKNLLDESMMKGPSDLLKAIENPDGAFAKHYIESELSNFLPFSVGMSQMARMMDPDAREAHGMIQTLMSKTPFVREGLTPKVGLWGQTIETPGSLLGMTAVNISPEVDDPLSARLKAIGYFPAMPSRTWKGVPLNDEQYSTLARNGGMMAHQMGSVYANMPGFDQLPVGIQERQLRTAMERARKIAEDQLPAMYPELLVPSIELKSAIRMDGHAAAKAKK